MTKGNPDPSPETRFETGNQTAITHGIESLRRTGEMPSSVATADLRTREAEIVKNLADLEGIEREMENATRVGLLCLELGASWLYKELEKGKSFADIKVLVRLRSYISGTVRDLRELASLKKDLGKDSSVIDAALEAAKDIGNVQN